jgi:hypothetical protein
VPRPRGTFVPDRPPGPGLRALPTAGARGHAGRMRTYRLVWRVIVTVVALVAVLATALTMPPGLFLAVALAMGLFGGLIAVSFQEDLADVRHPVVKGVVLAVSVTLLPGLSRLLGPAAAVAAVTVVLAAPWVVQKVLQRLRRRSGPTRIARAGLAEPDEALRRQWVESSRQLALATTPAERMVVVRVREQILDDVAARHGGWLPPYVWPLRDADSRDLRP